jgi:hypothetical protein
VAGYANGRLVLWDLVKYKKAYVATDVVKNEKNEFTLVKYIYRNSSNEINIATADNSGCIRLIQMTKSLIGTYRHQVYSLYESALKNVGTISVQKPSS